MTRKSRDEINRLMRERYAERRLSAISLLGNKCAKCGSVDRLEFDHINHSVKSFDIADRLGVYPWERIVEELKKCQLLCFSCHVNKSSIEYCGRPANQHGTEAMYSKKGCRCQACKEAKSKYQADYLARRKAIISLEIRNA